MSGDRNDPERIVGLLKTAHGKAFDGDWSEVQRLIDDAIDRVRELAKRFEEKKP